MVYEVFLPTLHVTIATMLKQPYRDLKLADALQTTDSSRWGRGGVESRLGR